MSFLGKGSEKASVKEHAERLFGLFSQIGLEAKLEAETSALADMGENVLAEENGKLFELLVRGLDEYVSASGESEVTLDLFGRMYLRIVSEYSVGSIPTALDAVLFGGADTAPLLEKRAVFVLGLREGAFPKTPSPTPLIPEKERAALEEQGVVVDLAPFEKTASRFQNSRGTNALISFSRSTTIFVATLWTLPALSPLLTLCQRNGLSL